MVVDKRISTLTYYSRQDSGYRKELLGHRARIYKPVIFYTNYSAIIVVATSLKTLSTERLNLRLFPIKIFYRPGKTNRIADALLRLLSISPIPAKEDDDLEALTAIPDPYYVLYSTQIDERDHDLATYIL
ncbi:hypothetical protein N7527_005489 [Penicillium freii]|nr:hypothetical protein N7527_005489 [Penicillium freii]